MTAGSTDADDPEVKGLGPDFIIEKPFECLRCNRPMRGANRMRGSDMRMHVDAAVICGECGNVMMMDKDMEPRAPSRREIIEMQAEGSIVIGLMSLCAALRSHIDKLHQERAEYAERAKALSGGCPHGD